MRATLQTMSTFSAYLQLKSEELLKDNTKALLHPTKRQKNVLLKKIRTFMLTKLTSEERLTIAEEDILKRIQPDPIYRGTFRMDVGRQTIHEKSQIEWIQKHVYPDAIKPKNTCFWKNTIHTYSKTPPKHNKTKTFDLFIPSMNIYCVLKHTSNAGGSQDNPFVEQAIDYLTANPEAPEAFEFYLDGNFYTYTRTHIAILEEMVPIHLQPLIIFTSCEQITNNGIG